MKIMEIIRSLDLPNNPLDDIIDQVISTYFPLLFKHFLLYVIFILAFLAFWEVQA